MLSFTFGGKCHTHYSTAPKHTLHPMENIDDAEYWIGEILAKTGHSDAALIPIENDGEAFAWFAQRIAGIDHEGTPNQWETQIFYNPDEASSFLKD